MKYQDFEKLITKIQNLRKRTSDVYMLGLDMTNYEDDFFQVIDILAEKAFGSLNKDWIDWYLYEKFPPGSKEPLKAFDENNNEICYDIKSLWEEVTK